MRCWLCFFSDMSVSRVSPSIMSPVICVPCNVASTLSSVVFLITGYLATCATVHAIYADSLAAAPEVAYPPPPPAQKNVSFSLQLS